MGCRRRVVRTGMIFVLPVLLVGCAAQQEKTSAPVTTSSASPSPSPSGPSLSGRDLEIAEANCRSYNALIEPTSDLHQSFTTGNGVRMSIGSWMRIYRTAKQGISYFSPVPTYPALNQAFGSVVAEYGKSLAKLDHYTMTTDMSAQVVHWNSADIEVFTLCNKLPSI